MATIECGILKNYSNNAHGELSPSYLKHGAYGKLQDVFGDLWFLYFSYKEKIIHEGNPKHRVGRTCLLSFGVFQQIDAALLSKWVGIASHLIG